MAQELTDPVIADARAASLVLLWLGDAIIAAAQDQNTDGRRRRECHCRVCCLAGRCLQLLILALPLRRPLPAIMSAENRTPHQDVDHGRDPSAASREPEISAAVAGRPSSRCRIGTGWRPGRSPFGAPRPNWHSPAAPDLADSSTPTFSRATRAAGGNRPALVHESIQIPSPQTRTSLG
jgi:hypothetical protein